MECEDCGSDDGYETTCPYAAEVSGNKIECILCSACYKERLEDI